MIEPTFEVELRGFASEVADPIDALMRGFGVSAARAESILDRLPAVVKRKANSDEALRYARALTKLGGDVQVRNEESGQTVTLDGLANFQRKRSGVIESADPQARRGLVPRAAFRSGSHPAIAFPKTGAGVTVTPSSLTALRSEQSIEAGEAEPREDDASPPPSSSSSNPPLVTLEQPLRPGARRPRDLLEAHPGPREAASALELDETAIPAGRDGASVPAIPEVLRQIRDFESASWEPLRPGVGLTMGDMGPPAHTSGERRIASASSSAAQAPAPSPGRPQPAYATDSSSAIPQKGPFPTKIIIGVLVAAAVVAVIFFIASRLGGLPPALREALETAGQTYVPALGMVDAESGSIGTMGELDRDVPFRLGRCQAWIATTDQPECDLDLYLYQGATLLTADALVDNVPVVFHCPDADTTLRLRLANAGTGSCQYGLARFEGQGSVGWPLEPYLTLYADYLSAMRRGDRFEAVSEVGHSSLGPGEVERLLVDIPAGHCYNVLAVVQQGSDLDLRLYVDDQLEAEDVALDNFPIVGYCAEQNLTATVEVEMYGGEGAYVHQVFEGRPLQ